MALVDQYLRIPDWPSYDPGWLEGVLWPKALNPDIAFDVDEINKEVWQYGVRLLWEIATKCPCQNSTGGNGPRADCPICGPDGSGEAGWEFHHPQVVRATMVGFNKQLHPYERWGEWAPGQVMFTVRSEYCPTPFDRYTLLDSTIPVSALMTRETDRAVEDGPRVVEALRWPIVQRVINMADGSTRSLDVVHIRPELPTGLPGATLVQGADYDISWTALDPTYYARPNGAIDWTRGDLKGTPTTPAKGCQFSIWYYTRPMFTVLEYSHAVRSTRTAIGRPVTGTLELPVQVTCKLDLFGAARKAVA
jgi:hypothetical protein